MADSQRIANVTAVSVEHHGLLIRGPSGSGKSGLALEMMARGAGLISDDGVVLTLRSGAIWITAPPPLRGLIEARGIGLLAADVVDTARLVAILDLHQTETERMPPLRQTQVMGQKVTLLHRYDSPYFPASLVQFLKSGRRE